MREKIILDCKVTDTIDTPKKAPLSNKTMWFLHMNFSVVKIAFIPLFVSIASIHHWPLYQLDIKKTFLHGDLEEVYMKQPTGWT